MGWILVPGSSALMLYGQVEKMFLRSVLLIKKKKKNPVNDFLHVVLLCVCKISINHVDRKQCMDIWKLCCWRRLTGRHSGVNMLIWLNYIDLHSCTTVLFPLFITKTNGMTPYSLYSSPLCWYQTVNHPSSSLSAVGHFSSFLSGVSRYRYFSDCVKYLGGGQVTAISSRLVNLICRACKCRGRWRVLLGSSLSFPNTPSGNFCGSEVLFFITVQKNVFVWKALIKGTFRNLFYDILCNLFRAKVKKVWAG